MSLKTNLFPIKFSEDRIRLWKIGQANDADAPVYRTLPQWTENGAHYTWPRENDPIPSGASIVEAAPYMLPALTLAIVRFALSNMEGIAIQDDRIEMEFGGRRFELEIIPPANGFQQFFLSIHPKQALDTSKGNFVEIKAVSNELAKIQFDNGHGTCLSFGDADAYLEWTLHDLPQLYFRTNGIGNHQDKWEGLREMGPLSHLEFRERKIECLVIAPKNKQGRIKRLLGELEKGEQVVDADQHFNHQWANGWADLFKLKSVSTFTEWVARPTDWAQLDELILDKCRDKESRTGKKYDLILLAPPSQTQDSTSILSSGKLAAMGLGIPCQEFKLPLPNGNDEKLRWLKETALQAYVKMGGQPWLLPSEQYADRLVIIGIGSTELKEGVAGFCTLFQRDGTFRLGNASHKASFEDWKENLADFVKEQISKLAREDNWKERDQVELVFHLPDESYLSEVPQLKRQLQEEILVRYQSNISFLLVDYDHSRWIWDIDRRGKGPQGKAAYVPRRGQAAIFPDRALLQLRGMDSPQAESNPLRIRLDEHSDNTDIGEFTRQIFRFAAISWRHYELGALPATLEYGNALTQQLVLIDALGRTTDLQKALLNHPHLKTWFL